MSKIEWTDKTWNPVWGCKAGCEYCYAKNLAKRFAYQIAEKETDTKTYTDIPTEDEVVRNRLAYKIENFEPVFLLDNFRNHKFPKKPSKIFIGSMSDIAFWKDEWLGLVASVIKEYPQHTFQLLTKFPKIYQKLDNIMPNNVWFGVTVTEQKEMSKLRTLQAIKQGKRKIYVSFEPLMTEIKNEFLLRTKDNQYPFRKLEHKYRTTLFDSLDWIIIGTMSGKKRTPAKIEWLQNIVKKAKQYEIPVFIKQIEINGKIEKDISKFPKELQLREFPVW